MKKDEFEYHSDRMYDTQSLAINIKVRDFGGPQAIDFIMRDFKCDEQVAQEALNDAWEYQQFSFWDNIDDIANKYLRAQFGKIKCYAEGRSGGWLVPHYKSSRPVLPVALATRKDVEHWDAIKVNAWSNFSKIVERYIKRLCSYEEIREVIEMNHYIEVFV